MVPPVRSSTSASAQGDTDNPLQSQLQLETRGEALPLPEGRSTLPHLIMDPETGTFEQLVSARRFLHPQISDYQQLGGPPDALDPVSAQRRGPFQPHGRHKTINSLNPTDISHHFK